MSAVDLPERAEEVMCNGNLFRIMRYPNGDYWYGSEDGRWTTGPFEGVEQARRHIEGQHGRGTA